MSSITLSLSIQKSNLQILHITFCKFFFKISKIEIVSQTFFFFFFSILKIETKIFLPIRPLIS